MLMLSLGRDGLREAVFLYYDRPGSDPLVPGTFRILQMFQALRLYRIRT